MASISSESGPIPVILVSGFLGAGKTTLMRRLILSAHARGLRAAVVVNEFGAADIDSHILKAGGAELMGSISGGCACCSGQEEMLFALLDIGQRRGSDRPDVILLEASGLADPILMLDSLCVAALLPLVRLGSLVSVVDHARFLLTRDEVAPLLIRQLQLADHIVLNKIDIAFRSEDRGTRVPELTAQLQEFSPRARIVPAKGCEFDLETIWARVLDDALRDADSAQVLVGASEAAHAHYQTVVCPVPHPIERARLESALRELGPEVWRAKGFVRLGGEAGVWLLQYTGGERGDFKMVPFDLPPGAKEPPTNLVFIGPALNRAALLREFGGHILLAMI